MNSVVRKMSVFAFVSLVAACGQKGGSLGLYSSSSSPANPQKESSVSFKLTDAPNKDLKSVFVNIDHMEVVVAGSGKEGRLILAKDLGVVDLLTLQNGVTLPLQDVIAPHGLQIQQIRLVLKEDGHYAVKSDNSLCDLKTPSAQKTGVKIILTNKVEFEAGHQYDIVVDFDALKSVVIQGNGGCLLKPVLKLKSAYKKPLENPDSGAGTNSGSSSSGSGPVAADPGAGTVGSGGSGTDVASGGGTELVTTPEQNNVVNGGWDVGVPSTTNPLPVLTPEEMRRM